MRVIGGLVSSDPERPVTARSLEAMACRVNGAKAPTLGLHGGVGFWWSPSVGSIEAAEGVSMVGDIDLTNTEALVALTGAPRDNLGRVLSLLYRGEGATFVGRLRGAFALAMWDVRERVLVLAVDPFGLRRMYYVTDAEGTAFASRASALLAVPGMDRGIDPTGVYNYLNFGYVPAPGSIFAGIHRLPPGHLLRVEHGGTRLERYWDMPYVERPVPVDEAAAALLTGVEKAVETTIWEGSSKKVGAFLSGGTDSSAVVAMTGRLTGERVNAFSIGFREERYDELGYAETSARHVNASHYTKIVGPEEALGAVPGLVDAYDEPFGNSSAIGTLFCAQLARDCGIRRLLAGDGGDEIFGGNERYRRDRIFSLYHSIPAVVRQGILEPVLLSLPAARAGRGLAGRAGRYVHRANLANPERFYFSEFLWAREAGDLLAPDFLATVPADAPYTVLRLHYARAGNAAELNRLMYLDLKLTVGDNDLLKVTRTAELADVAVRFPLLDRDLVELTGTWPTSLKVRWLEKRYLFKRAFGGLLHPETLAKRKHGFGVPTGLWLKSHPGFREFARDVLLSPTGRQRGYFRPGAIEGLFARLSTDTTPYFGDILWTALMLELWHRGHVDRRGAA